MNSQSAVNDFIDIRNKLVKEYNILPTLESRKVLTKNKQLIWEMSQRINKSESNVLAVIKNNKEKEKQKREKIAREQKLKEEKRFNEKRDYINSLIGKEIYL
jgi:hypothetical protein